MNGINIEEIIIVNAAGVLILILSLMSRIGNKKEKHLDDRLFDTMIRITIGALVIETLTFLLDGRSGKLIYYLQYLLNGYLFLASCGVGALWVLYVELRIYKSMKRIRKRMWSVLLPLAVLAILIVCDFFGTGFIFSITEENVYLRGRLVILSYLILFYEYFCSIFLALRAVKKNNHAQFLPIFYFVLPCFTGTVIQGFCYGLSVGWFCVSLAFMFVQMQLNNQNAFLDDLSGLYNRKYYQYIIHTLINSKKHQNISGIMMDVNDFKRINDQFGHTMGDDAIRNLGRLISEVITEQDKAFRHAGDEFIIISHAEDEKYAEWMIDALTKKLERFNETSGKPYKLSLAIGHTVCKAAELNSDKFLHRMDTEMYEAKRRYYLQEGKERRKHT